MARVALLLAFVFVTPFYVKATTYGHWEGKYAFWQESCSFRSCGKPQSCYEDELYKVEVKCPPKSDIRDLFGPKVVVPENLTKGQIQAEVSAKEQALRQNEQLLKNARTDLKNAEQEYDREKQALMKLNAEMANTATGRGLSAQMDRVTGDTESIKRNAQRLRELGSRTENVERLATKVEGIQTKVKELEGHVEGYEENERYFRAQIRAYNNQVPAPDPVYVAPASVNPASGRPAPSPEVRDEVRAQNVRTQARSLANQTNNLEQRVAAIRAEYRHSEVALYLKEVMFRMEGNLCSGIKECSKGRANLKIEEMFGSDQEILKGMDNKTRTQ